jgi:hypothetical protein
LWHLSLYTMYYMCCLLWGMYEMHPALSLETGCDTHEHNKPYFFWYVQQKNRSLKQRIPCHKCSLGLKGIQPKPNHMVDRRDQSEKHEIPWERLPRARGFKSKMKIGGGSRGEWDPPNGTWFPFDLGNIWGLRDFGERKKWVRWWLEKPVKLGVERGGKRSPF